MSRSFLVDSLISRPQGPAGLPAPALPPAPFQMPCGVPPAYLWGLGLHGLYQQPHGVLRPVAARPALHLPSDFSLQSLSHHELLGQRLRQQPQLLQHQHHHQQNRIHADIPVHPHYGQNLFDWYLKDKYLSLLEKNFPTFLQNGQLKSL
ncbi:uncharacterized protein LOC127749801 [Frankliniella occidentalis]|uniref:Uncharacterized protein LOC127749801 n=1 Tax=Frankliniella occidentalis TaxID=133901 RepID=A0A9C6UE28_FRAOC|nr:uncharacterized protein LOC127749801 [Frankliniella occidentalis]